MMRRPRSRVAIVGALPLLAAGCLLSPRRDPTVFLVLAPLEEDRGAVGQGQGAPPAIARPELRLGVGPVTLPRYLERPQLVTRIDATELAVHEHARWSAPLGALVAETVAEHLMARLGPGSVAVFPWSQLERPGVSVRIAVQQFEAVSPDAAVLRARWELVDAAGNRVGEPRSSEYRTPSSRDPKAAVTALSRLLGLLSADIATALR